MAARGRTRGRPAGWPPRIRRFCWRMVRGGASADSSHYRLNVFHILLPELPGAGTKTFGLRQRTS